MKPTAVFAFVLVITASAVGDALAREPEPLVWLYDHIAGPAVRTWSLKLEPDGKVVEEHYDLALRPTLRVRIRCRLTREESQRVVEASERSVRALPSIIQDDQAVPLDGPFKSLSVRNGADGSSSHWKAPREANLSTKAQEFEQAWETIQGLLACVDGS